MSSITVANSNAKWSTDTLTTKITYENALVTKDPKNNKYHVEPFSKDYEFKVDLKAGKVGLLLVGLAGNNGSTFVAAHLANKHKVSFENKDGVVKPNYFGSVTQASTIKIGVDATGRDVYVPFNSIVPFVNPDDLVIGGWDINNANLKDACKRAKVLDVNLQDKLAEKLEEYKPMPSIYYPDFIALNQKDRANNVYNSKNNQIDLDNKWDHVTKIRNDIKEFKNKNGLDKVIVLWTANTERYSSIIEGINDTAENLINAIKNGHKEVSQSTIFAVASILENSIFINGSPQNTLVPGVVNLAEEHKSFIVGDDFKSGQTKFKSVLAQFLVDAGIRPVSIASYNHLGNNDGFNLSSHEQFRSKEISKSSVVDDIIASNQILYNDELGKKIDHTIVIKYMKAVGDSKVALDEYYSELMLGGHNRISISNVCEDSLLATPLVLDLVIVSEFLSRITYKSLDDNNANFEKLYPILGFLGYWLKAPLTRKGFQTINGLNKQKLAIENFLKLLVGIPISNELRFEERLN
ncbi:probable Inositol-3-phosphate synthase [Saccharomycodes ludwigii]|uniref:Inositol-3-phosphate synthase n=1 Tax=Saccharomycodes ludwigii TaxID=36035 RepID=A0A376BAP7_9ASCO|nr:hypothetical protein SCDLUD_000017 [Saccharomycodes ludwigii]KAH3902440.1 hypothetical protein SCDLUD_000017 [Saccharomycodes ludwigii]SSD61726.1 probable Inositol-3-phosphate synthase [Saccharomycodes ludwigii]